MTSVNSILRTLIILLAVALALPALAQEEKTTITNWRPYDQRGVNVFEPAKEVDTQFDGLKVRVGGSFAQQYQALEHGNNAKVKLASDGKTNLNKLYDLGSGFNLATANLNLDVQLEDGIRISLENYMSARHHQEFWVKGGYIQVDKLPMFNNPDWYSKYVRVKIGHFQVNYGDQQFRRTDNGNAIYNPFVGNYLMDAFATEIGGEVYLFPTQNLMAMVGVTNGLIKGDVSNTTRKPSLYGKVAFDRQFNDDFRFRLSGSVYSNKESGRNTLYSGDRAGSRFYFAMEPEYYISGGALTKTGTDNRFTSGRVNPGFTTNVTSWQIAPFVKFKGLEVFATYEQSSGYAGSDPKKEGQLKPEKRTVNQVAVEGIYRFLPREQVYLGARYNTVSGELEARMLDDQSNPLDLTVNRIEIVAGWYATRNLLLKASYVNQDYANFEKTGGISKPELNNTDYRSEGYFKGFMIEAVVGF